MLENMAWTRNQTVQLRANVTATALMHVSKITIQKKKKHFLTIVKFCVNILYLSYDPHFQGLSLFLVVLYLYRSLIYESWGRLD